MTPEQLEAERKLFEAWARKARFDLSEFRPGIYGSPTTRVALEGWLAGRASLAAERKPLTDEQIAEGRFTSIGSVGFPAAWGFQQGVRFAERAHGITGEAG